MPRASKNVSAMKRIEWPTWAALAACYLAWGALTLAAPAAPLAHVALAVVIAFHSSLQHEAIHGHPTRNAALNHALVFPPLGLSFPFIRYRDTHLAHHLDNRLTDPYDDPESWYFDPEVWRVAPRAVRGLYWVNNTVLGRMALGPGISFIRFLMADMRAIAGGDRHVAVAWALHVAGTVPVITWLWWAGVSATGYALAAYAGLSLINLRSFLEHRAEERAAARSVVVEDAGPLALLYLNNNLHAVHHAHPEMPWYDLPAHYRLHRDRFLAMNGGYVYRGYGAILRAFAIRAKEPPPHPLMTPEEGRHT